MALEEQIEQYKSQKYAVRLSLAAALGLVLPGYIYYEQSAIVAEELALAEQGVAQANVKLNESKKKQAQLPTKLLELEKAKMDLGNKQKRFSRDFDMDEILREVSVAARDFGVSMESFRPDAPSEVGTKVRFLQQRVALKLQGKFIPVVRFLDAVLNFESLIFIQNLNFKQMNKDILLRKDEPTNRVVNVGELKDAIHVVSDANLLIFRKVVVE